MGFSRNFDDIQEAWGFRIASWWGGLGAQLSREEHDELQRALKVARDDFLMWARPESWISDNAEMHNLRCLLARTGAAGRSPINKMNNLQVTRAICRAIEQGSLLFVPTREDVERYLDEERKRRRYAARTDGPPVPGALTRAVQPTQLTSPVPASPAVPLSGAQPLEYSDDDLRDTVDKEELAGTTNEKYARKIFGYDSCTFREMIHRFKKTNGIGPNDDLEFEENGDVYFNGDYIDNFHGYDN
jgi:hypothetical protein